MTPEERRAKLEKVLVTSEDALEVLIFRWIYKYGENCIPHLTVAPNMERYYRLEKICESEKAHGNRYIPILIPLGYSENGRDSWPYNSTERALAESFSSIDELIHDALALGFIDQATRMSRAWEQSK